MISPSFSLFETGDEGPGGERSFTILGLPGGSIFLPLNNLIAKQGEEVNFREMAND
jgi:hypothetical protein